MEGNLLDTGGGDGREGLERRHLRLSLGRGGGSGERAASALRAKCLKSAVSVKSLSGTKSCRDPLSGSLP